MDTSDWMTKLRGGFLDALRAIDRNGDDGFASAIFAFWTVVDQAPHDVRACYERYSEAEIAARAAEVDLSSDTFGLDVVKLVDEDSAVFEIGACLRALDIEARDYDFGSLSSTPDVDHLVQFEGDSGYLLPISRRLWPNCRGAEIDKRPFRQRALRRHRLMPIRLDGADVELHLSHRPGSLAGPLNFGAALFPDMTFKFDEDDKSFIVTEVVCSQHAVVVDEALKRSHLDRCVGVVLPELTIDEAAVTDISGRLARKTWRAGQDADPGGRTPAFFVAGSWHREVAGGHANVAPLLDGDGVPIFEHHKRKAYYERGGKYERIVAGRKLGVLVMDECLVAIGICLDFCDQSSEMIYDRLDVDLVLVPSCGHDTTMSSHVDNAKVLARRRKTRTFVVQQIDRKDGDSTGYVLAPHELKAFESARPSDLRVADTWRLVSA